MPTSRGWLFASTFATVALACNALLDLDQLTPYTPTEAGIFDGSSGSLPDTGSPQPDASSSSGGSSSGGSEGDAGVAPCDPNERPDPRGNVFVKAGSDGDGRMNNPFGSVASAIDKLVELTARDGGPAPEDPDAGPRTPTIYVYGGSYSESRALVVEGLPSFAIEGAWSGTLTEWVRDCSEQRRSNTVINASGSRGLILRDIPGPSRIANLALFTNDDGNDPSRIGVQVVRSGPLTISNSIIVAENASHGAAPSPGVLGEPVCTNAITAACKASPAAGSDGPPGSDGIAGVFTQAGFAPGSGMPGTDGTAGEPSRPGNRLQAQCAVSCPPLADDAEVCTAPVIEPVSGPEGNCGCGGGKGGAGGGGLGGGASVAVLSSSPLLVEYSILQSKDGGDGHGGGSGAAGGPGVAAAPAAPVTCSPPAAGCCLAAEEPFCRLASSMPMGSACFAAPLEIPGPPVTTGAGGGRGGNGGNGAGGPSYTVVLLPGGSAEYIETNRSYGVGGDGAGSAPPGGSAPELTIANQ